MKCFVVDRPQLTNDVNKDGGFWRQLGRVLNVDINKLVNHHNNNVDNVQSSNT